MIGGIEGCEDMVMARCLMVEGWSVRGDDLESPRGCFCIPTPSLHKGLEMLPVV